MIDFLGVVSIKSSDGAVLDEPTIAFIWTGHGWRADNISVTMGATPQMLEPFALYVIDGLGERRLVATIKAEPRVFQPGERILIGLTLEMPLSCPICLMNSGGGLEFDPTEAIAGIARIALETE